MQNYTIGMDIGGTKTAIGLVGKNGKILNKIKFPTEINKGFNIIIEKIVNGLKDLGVEKIGKVGIGIAGQIDSEKGIVVFSPNIPRWKNIPIIKTLENRLGREFKLENDFKIEVENDANCFALGEYVYGAGKDIDYMVGITLGTGIGGGLIFNDKLYKGQGFASELGHMVIMSDGVKCTCGNKGCLENYASGRAIEDLYFKKKKRKKRALDIEKEAMLNGEKSAAYKIYEEAGRCLGVGFSNIINILDPDIILVGGGLSDSKMILKFAKKEAQKNIFFKKRKVIIKKSKLGQDAGIIGATLLVK
jgi:glucokinase